MCGIYLEEDKDARQESGAGEDEKSARAANRQIDRSKSEGHCEIEYLTGVVFKCGQEGIGARNEYIFSLLIKLYWLFCVWTHPSHRVGVGQGWPSNTGRKGLSCHQEEQRTRAWRKYAWSQLKNEPATTF
jgi:hypothetical protein